MTSPGEIDRRLSELEADESHPTWRAFLEGDEAAAEYWGAKIASAKRGDTDADRGRE